MKKTTISYRYAFALFFLFNFVRVVQEMNTLAQVPALTGNVITGITNSSNGGEDHDDYEVGIDNNTTEQHDVMNAASPHEIIADYNHDTEITRITGSEDDDEDTIAIATTPREIMAEHVDKKLNGTDRMKNIVAARLGLMQPSPDIVEEMSKVNISIVVSHCENNVKWIAGYVGKEYSIKDITIYSKCGKEVEGLKELKELLALTAVNVITLPNVGRNDHAFAYWIKEHYESINKEKNEKNENNNDIVMFLKDSNRHQKRFIPIDLLFSHASKSGFGCVTKPLCDCHCNVEQQDVPMMQHQRKSFEKFTLGTYERLERDDTIVFKNKRYPVMKSWKDDMGFVIPMSETIPVCYEGLFVAQKKQILNQPSTAWKEMERSLSRGDNIIEGHYAERMWASILSDVDDESARAVDEVLKPHINVGQCRAMPGLTYIKNT